MDDDRDIALVLCYGGLAGAVSAGFVAAICRELDIEYFSTVYGYSVGAYAASFGVANQPDIIEEVWRNHVDRRKLVDKTNFLTFGVKPVLKLNYLKRLFEEDFSLKTQNIEESKTDLRFVLLDSEGNIEFKKPEEKDILDLMAAASAVPFIHGFYEVKGKKYLDASFVYGSVPGIKDILQEHEKLVVVQNFPKNYSFYGSSLMETCEEILFPLISKMYPEELQRIFRQRQERREKMNEFLERNENIILLRPPYLPLKTGGDTNKERINLAFDEGIKLAKEFIRSVKD